MLQTDGRIHYYQFPFHRRPIESLTVRHAIILLTLLLGVFMNHPAAAFDMSLISDASGLMRVRVVSVEAKEDRRGDALGDSSTIAEVSFEIKQASGCRFKTLSITSDSPAQPKIGFDVKPPTAKSFTPGHEYWIMTYANPEKGFCNTEQLRWWKTGNKETDSIFTDLINKDAFHNQPHTSYAQNISVLYYPAEAGKMQVTVIDRLSDTLWGKSFDGEPVANRLQALLLLKAREAGEDLNYQLIGVDADLPVLHLTLFQDSPPGMMPNGKYEFSYDFDLITGKLLHEQVISLVGANLISAAWYDKNGQAIKRLPEK